MINRMVLISLLFFSWLATTGCTPTSDTAVTIPPTRLVASSTPHSNISTNVPSATTTPLAADIQATQIALLAEATPIPTMVTLSIEDILATQTAKPPLPTITPSATPTLRPTLTPYPGLTWRILFQAVPCPNTNVSCNNDLFMSQRSQWYVVESDGSNLVALEDTGTFLADMWGYPYLSPDGTQLAYLVRSGVDTELHVTLAEVNNGNASDLGPLSGRFRDLRFLSETGCLAIYTSPGLDKMPTIETLTVTKLCTSAAPQVLETIEFPDLRPALNDYHLSPEGDAILITTRSTSGVPEIYIYEFGSQQPPQLLFSAEDETWFISGPIRWQPNGQKVEFFLQHGEPDGLIQILLYTIDRKGVRDDNSLELKLPFSINGDWSPDGREIAFFGMTDYTPEASGIYILDLKTGEWRQILSEFYSDVPLIQNWQADVP